MNRRTFLKILAAAGLAPVLPQMNSLSSMYKSAYAAIDYSTLTITPPSVMPQVINLFLYGGPSELAGNLSNIADIELNSENKYTKFFSGITTAQGTGVDGSITPKGFWGGNDSPAINNEDNRLGAGGDDMEFLVDQGHMSVYRTMISRKNTSQSHRENILMSQKGSLDTEFSAGMGNKLASIIFKRRDVFEGGTAYLAGPGAGTLITDVEQLVMPFVSILDGDTQVFNKGDSEPLPLLFNGVSVNQDLSNPFTRDISRLGDASTTAEVQSAMLDGLVQQSLSASTENDTEVVEAFQQREELDEAMKVFGGGFVLPTLTVAADIAANGNSSALSYPNTGVGGSLQAAVTLAVENPGTLFTTLGGDFGGWDDHNNGVDEYPERMREVFEALRVAMMHIKYSGRDQGLPAGVVTPITGLSRPTKNIIINVFGDFGRRVNLNSSLGWNHGNNQNLYTLGGSRNGIRLPIGANALGNVVGETVRVGVTGDDEQYTVPKTDSYQFEPISVAANTFKHFGVVYPAEVNEATPDPLTAAFDPDNPSVMLDPGFPPIDEDPTTNGGV